MPHLAKVISGGVRGNHSTLYPALSPMLWTSIATGKRPAKHGIHGFTEPTEDGLSIRPVSNLGRRSKAFWNILNQHGKRSVVVGWWPSHPAEPIAGAMVSNHFAFHTTQHPGMPMPPAAVWPPEEARALAELRVHPTEISSDILRLFAPEWVRVNQKDDSSVHDLAGLIAETMSIHAAATDLMARIEWDLAAVYYVGIDHFSHRFMRFHAGKARAEKPSDPEWFRGIVANAYRYHDVMLGRLLALAGEDCGVMVISDHGFHSDTLLPDYIPAEAAGPAVEHRHFGIYCLRAPGVKRGERVYGASVLDVAPTILHLFGIPAGIDMDGNVLINAFEDQRLPEPVPSWDEIPGDDGRHPPSRYYDSASAAEAVRQLVALGYIAPPGEDGRRTVAETMLENRYNLARSYIDEGRPGAAAEILRALLGEDGDDARFHQHLFQCYLMSNDTTGALRVLDAFDRACAEFTPRAREELNRRREERKDDELNPDRHSPDQRERHQRRVLMEKASGYVSPRLMMRIRLELARPNRSARRDAVRGMMETLARGAGRDLGWASFLAEGFAALGDFDRALTFTRRLLRADPENAAALALNAKIYQAQGKHEHAVRRAIESLALVYVQPALHCLLGRSLIVLREWRRAEEAFRVALAQAPGFPQAHEGLSQLLRRDRARLGEAGLHMALASQERKKRRQARLQRAVGAASAIAPPIVTTPGLDGTVPRDIGPPADRSRFVTIVSGLPRSGTSMMMQMLTAGGMTPYTDGLRAADADNPRGYFEHENATRLHLDHSWVAEARGKVVKIVAQLLPHLPGGEDYRIVFMHRAMHEVTASQSAMLRRLGERGAKLSARQLERAYASQLVRVQEWLKRTPGVCVLPMQYTETLENPREAADKLAPFLGDPFDPALAASCVDPGLRRQRS
jgi:predicted AlkP superfamily phosphohydrolase/phosphomutase/tetratricopeptide (TPR) repeat protein